MKKKLASLLLMIGGLFAGAASVGCLSMIIDEPEMPKHLIER